MDSQIRSDGISPDNKTPVHDYRDLVELPVNGAQPMMMHIDLNSCFSTIEQQANPLIRNKPVAVGAYTRDSGILLAASYDAKAMGIKLGTSVREAREICPGIIILMPDPPKYREAHRRFREVLTAYTDQVVAKSIDEFVVDFHGSPAIQAGRSMEAIGYKIKERIKESLGEYVTVNVGIGTNRFLAKLAAGLHKPDGLDVITPDNILEIYKTIPLTDLPGINRRFKARLQAAGIGTPYDMYQASGNYLRDFVFFSKLGHAWHQRLRGWEVDAVEWGRKSIGHQYALEHKTTDREEIKRILMKLCEKTGRRLRRHGYTAGGVQRAIRYVKSSGGKPSNGPSGRGGYPFWHQSHKTNHPLYATQEIYRAAEHLLNGVRFMDKVSQISVGVFNLDTDTSQQIGLFDNGIGDGKGGREQLAALARAADNANDRYGEFTVVPAIMADMNKTILDRIAFGNVQDIGH
jgi:DNA polymerase-4